MHLLAEDGLYLATLEFDRPWYDFALRGGVLYTLEQSEGTGVVSLVARRIDVAGSLLDRAAAIAR